jgi:hypothetical protein
MMRTAPLRLVPLAVIGGLLALVALVASMSTPGIRRVPPGILDRRAPLLFVAVALLPGLFPRGPIPTIVILISAHGWLATGSGFDLHGTTFARMCVLAALIYVIHVGCALAAVLPYDAIVTKGVFRPYLISAFIVLAVTAFLALFVIDLTGFAQGHREVIASIVGVFVTLAISGYLTLLGRRRSER